MVKGNEKIHPKLYQKHEKLSVSSDQIIYFHECILVPPTLRNGMLKYLHSNHMGRDKILSNARSLCWWPNLNLEMFKFCTGQLFNTVLLHDTHQRLRHGEVAEVHAFCLQPNGRVRSREKDITY